MYKIAVIYSAYPDLTEVAEKFIRKKGYHVEISIAVLDKAVELAKEYENDGYDLIISRGITGLLIRKAVRIPVILVDITNFDILHTLYKARQLGNKIAYFQYFRSVKHHDLDSIREILGMTTQELQIYDFKNELELQEKMDIIYNSSVDVVVATGAYLLGVAKQRGVKTFMVRSTKEAIYNAFEQAENILNIQYEDKTLVDYFINFADKAFEGFIILDSSETIKHISASTCNILDLQSQIVIGKKYPEVILNLKKVQLNNDCIEAFINGQHLNFKRVPLFNAKEVLGYAIIISLSEQSQKNKQRRIAVTSEKGFVASYTFSDLVGKSKKLVNLTEKAKKYSNTDSTVLMLGESGTGKEILANSIHNASKRKNGPFVAINCAALPESILESELFGYEEGAFTGARKGGKPGLFEIANQGTIFLDEISEIPLSSQAHLLRVLQEKCIRRVGGDKNIPVDCRVIAATNADLSNRVRLRQFREDLYYRLNVLNLRLPPLRERKDDIPVLIKHFIEQSGDGNTKKMPDYYIKKLQDYNWPGNVRELKNFIEKYVVLSTVSDNTFDLLEELYYDLTSTEIYSTKDEGNCLTVEIGTLKQMELRIIELLNKKYGDNKTDLSRRLGISRSKLWSKLKELDEQ